MVLDAGITISFRARVPNSGPLDEIYTTDDQGVPTVLPWFDGPEDTVGRGYPIHDEGRGQFGVVQNDAGVFGFDQDSAVAFSLMTSDDVAEVCAFGANSSLCASPEQRGGLIMNNRVGSTPTADIDTFDEGTLNLLEIDDEGLDDWREFWITIEGENGPGTHEVNVYLDGEETPTTFHVTASNDGNAELLDDAWLFMGMSSSSLFGSVDVDFFSYTLEVVAPQAAQVLGDMDCDGDVDFDDIDAMVLALRRPDEYESTYGVPPELKGDIDGDGDLDFDDVDPGFIDILRGGLHSVPEPSTVNILAVGCCLAYCRRMVVALGARGGGGGPLENASKWPSYGGLQIAAVGCDGQKFIAEVGLEPARALPPGGFQVQASGYARVHVATVLRQLRHLCQFHYSLK